MHNPFAYAPKDVGHYHGIISVVMVGINYHVHNYSHEQ